jgi:hypothetical protein
VAAWAWPTLVASWRRVLEVVFILLESPSPSRKIFIGSIHSPLSGLSYWSFIGGCVSQLKRNLLHYAIATLTSATTFN